MQVCSNFCGSNCKRRHHPVFLSLVGVRNKQTLERFKQTLRAYQITGFQLGLNIPDPNPDFRYPLLHWAAVLEKIDVLKMLIRPPFNVDTKIKSDDNESVLHRLLLFWNVDTSLDTISRLVSILKDCVGTVDQQRRTPLHVCALYLTTCSKKELTFWKHVFYSMVDTINGDSLRREILDKKDENGDTVLHLLSKRCELLELVKHVLYCNADQNTVNNLGLTPLEISWRYALTIYNYLQVHDANQQSDSDSNCSDFGRITRASVALSETKDYTGFFQGDDSSDEEELELKRKISESNIALINKLEKLTTSSCAEENDDLDEICCKRRYKRRRIFSDSESDSQDETKSKQNNQNEVNYFHNEAINTTSQTNSLRDVINLFNVDVNLMDRSKSLDELSQHIKDTINCIKEMYTDMDADHTEKVDGSPNRSEDDNVSDDNDDNAFIDDDESLQSNVLALNGKIKTMEEILLRMTS